MNNACAHKRSSSGFTLMEVIVVICMIAILSAIAIPRFMDALPRYRLKAAARDLYSNMQMARIGAVKTHTPWAVVFVPGSNAYSVYSSYGTANTVVKTVSLSSYGSGVAFGILPSGANPVTYTSPDDVVRFDSQGLADDKGYCYLLNSQGNEGYKIGTPFTVSGVIRMQKWNGTAYQ